MDPVFNMLVAGLLLTLLFILKGVSRLLVSTVIVTKKEINSPLILIMIIMPDVIVGFMLLIYLCFIFL